MPTLASQFSILSTSGFLFLTSITSAHAQESKEVTPEIKVSPVETKDKPQQVDIKAKSEVDNAKRDTAAKTVITNEVLMRFGDTNINDAMKRVPGVLVVKDQLQLPGMNAGYTQILIDGEPPRGIAITDLPMNIIDRVEIYRGGNAQFSSQAMAGTINIVLKRVPSNTQAQIKANIANSYKTTSGLEWLASDKHKNLSYSLSLNIRDSGGTLSGPTFIANDFLDDTNQTTQKYVQIMRRDANAYSLRINPRVNYNSEAGTTLTSTSSLILNRVGFMSKSEYDFQLGSPLPIGKILRDYRSDSNFGNTSLRVLSSTGDLKLDIIAGVNLSTSASTSKDRTFDPRDKSFFDRNVYTHRKTSAYNNTGKITAPSSEAHDIVGGWTASKSLDDTHRKETQWNYLPVSTTEDFQATRAVIDKVAFFIQDEWRFRKQSSAYFGLRWESIKIVSNDTLQEKLQHQSTILSPIVQGLWQLNPDNTDRLRLGLSRSFQAPAEILLVSPIYKSLNNSILSTNFRGNPALRPELAWSLDAAYEHNGNNEWNYTIRSKFRRISDLHRESISFYADAWWRTFINAGDAISKSLEFDTQFPLKCFIEGAPNIDISFDLNKNWSKVYYLPAPNNILSPNTVNAKLSMDFRAKNLPLTLGYNLRYSDSHWQQTSASERSFSTTPLELDLYFLWKLNQKTLLRASVDNLLKRQSLSLSEQRFSDLRTSSNSFSPVYRKLSLNLEHKF